MAEPFEWEGEGDLDSLGLVSREDTDADADLEDPRNSHDILERALFHFGGAPALEDGEPLVGRWKLRLERVE